MFYYEGNANFQNDPRTGIRLGTIEIVIEEVDTGNVLKNIKFLFHQCIMTFWSFTIYTGTLHRPDFTLHHGLNTELKL